MQFVCLVFDSIVVVLDCTESKNYSTPLIDILVVLDQKDYVPT